jgi:endonuclease YncB( thermonuclease family)
MPPSRAAAGDGSHTMPVTGLTMGCRKPKPPFLGAVIGSTSSPRCRGTDRPEREDWAVDRVAYGCGIAATAKLRCLIGDHAVVYERRDTDRYGRRWRCAGPARSRSTGRSCVPAGQSRNSISAPSMSTTKPRRASRNLAGRLSAALALAAGALAPLTITKRAFRRFALRAACDS